MTNECVVLDYGAGNIRSIERALEEVGLSPLVLGAGRSHAFPAAAAPLLVLPGQGHFGQVASAFQSSGFEGLVRSHIAAGRPFLGICVGLQLLFDGSEEAPGSRGLGLLRGTVKRFPAGRAAVPQMGWNRLDVRGSSPLLRGIASGEHVYFANSYYAELPTGTTVAGSALCSYAGVEFAAAFSIGNLHATQFHPEKSQRAGLRILANLTTPATTGLA